MNLYAYECMERSLALVLFQEFGVSLSETSASEDAPLLNAAFLRLPSFSIAIHTQISDNHEPTTQKRSYSRRIQKDASQISPGLPEL